eukprot:TRINITY_DN61235_c0_g1_i1.p1 TRINITY_DN61235_c0_g1~~TRINITY_DN61235_c0_g1_i1.p1  ORF type:complete len:256 (+),score=12.41 TRINITY_DN61235_c0_g1_i1:40-807(+)
MRPSALVGTFILGLVYLYLYTFLYTDTEEPPHRIAPSTPMAIVPIAPIQPPVVAVSAVAPAITPATPVLATTAPVATNGPTNLSITQDEPKRPMQRRPYKHPFQPLVNAQEEQEPESEDLSWVDWVSGEFNLPLTREVQAAIYRHQNPMNCNNKKFIVWQMYNSGLGNDFHLLSWALASALNLDRVLAVSGAINQGNKWKYCKDCTPSSPDYYFQPLTNCSLDLIWKSKPYYGKNGLVNPKASNLGQNYRQDMLG